MENGPAPVEEPAPGTRLFRRSPGARPDPRARGACKNDSSPGESHVLHAKAGSLPGDADKKHLPTVKGNHDAPGEAQRATNAPRLSQGVSQLQALASAAPTARAARGSKGLSFFLSDAL